MLPLLSDPDGYAFITDGEGWVGNGVAERLHVKGPDRFAEATEWARETLRGEDVAFGSFSFDPAGTSTIVRPAEVHRVRTGDDLGRARLTGGRVRYAGSTVDEVAWMEAVATATGRITDGAYQKIVLARDLHVWAEQELDPLSLVGRLADRFPTCFTFLHERFLGATPELLVARTGRTVESVVLAGTAPPDEASGRQLLASAKDAEEHAYARDSAIEALGPLCDTVEASPEPFLLRLDSLQHLATRVTGVLADDHHVLEVVDRLHPTAAVGGAPRAAAVRDIGPLEQMDRGRYTGPVGVVRANGDGVLGIALRCAQLDGRRARLFAGCGIVADSLPDAELAETRLKLKAMQSVLEG